jgi:hypothetical protein
LELYLFKVLRKAGHISLSLILVISLAGFTVTHQYCKNTLVNIKVNSLPKPCCNTHGCCHSETRVFQLKIDLLITGPVENPLIKTMAVFYNANSIPTVIGATHSAKISVKAAESPPPLKEHTVLSFLQTFLC